MSALVVSKLSGEEATLPNDSIDLDEPSVVQLTLARANVETFERQGADLLIHLATGETITIQDFYLTGEDGEFSELVLQEEDGSLWWLRTESGLDAAQYSPLSDLD